MSWARTLEKKALLFWKKRSKKLLITEGFDGAGATTRRK
jgi:hypothetical protein